MKKQVLEPNVEQVVLPISIVIPTYSEEESLPKLLESIKSQVFAPTEVIVADAFSKDKTREIAKSFGCIVVDGGKIAVGRNAGEKVAKSNYILFLDADCELPNPMALGEAFFQFQKKDVDIASTRYVVSKSETPGFGRSAGKVIYGFGNAVKKVQTIVSYPKWEGGAFILVKKSVFEHVGGFDEKLSVGEDREFFQKAVRLGYKYRSLDVDFATSVRRYNSPKKLLKLLAWVTLETVIVTAGIYAGSQALKRLWKLYGPLGGGAGKDPNAE